MDKLDSIFENFVSHNLFKDKSVLQSNYNPNIIPHRQEQIEAVASILGPTLRGDKASNLLIYGNTGTGKTLVVQYVGKKILEKLKAMDKNHVKIVYVNCKLGKVAETEYRIAAEMVHELGGSVPATGLPTQEVWNRFVKLVDGQKQIVVLVLDEIDQLTKNDTLYTLTRINTQLIQSQITLVGISNRPAFKDDMDPRAKSSLGEEDLVFPPYDALQLKDILKERSDQAFKEGVIDMGLISKCAAYAAREHGDARRALDLLRVAGELAEREQNKKVEERHIDEAKEKIERDKMLDVIETEPRQFKLVLSAIFTLHEKTGGKDMFTGDVFRSYEELCTKTHDEVLTQRRISDIISEFDMLGIINVATISKGRHGRTREIHLILSPHLQEKAKELIAKSLNT